MSPFSLRAQPLWPSSSNRHGRDGTSENWCGRGATREGGTEAVGDQGARARERQPYRPVPVAPPPGGRPRSFRCPSWSRWLLVQPWVASPQKWRATLSSYIVDRKVVTRFFSSPCDQSRNSHWHGFPRASPVLLASLACGGGASTVRCERRGLGEHSLVRDRLSCLPRLRGRREHRQVRAEGAWQTLSGTRSPAPAGEDGDRARSCRPCLRGRREHR
jgi:hypothetical protein